MTFAKAALAWLSIAVASPVFAEGHLVEHDPPDDNERDSSAPVPQKKRRRSHVAPVDLDEFMKGFFGPYCQKLNCASSFASESNVTHNAKLLKVEQDRFAAFIEEKDRKRFVTEHVPYAKLALDSMMAAGQPVCTKFFTTSFGVSRGLIDAVKCNPGARASSKIGRLVVGALRTGLQSAKLYCFRLRRSMGLCSSSNPGLRWEERWSAPHCKKTLGEFCSDEMKNGEAIVTGTAPKSKVSKDEDTPSKALRGVSKDGEFRNWAASVQTAPAKVLRPKSVRDVQGFLAQARGQSPSPKIRCMGSGHSWTHLFADDGAWMFDTSGMKDLVWSAESHPTQVTIGPGVTPSQLGTFFDSKDRGKWRGLFLSSDVVLETVTYGGTISSACHGTGKTQTLPDYVLKMSIIKWDGTQVDLNRADDPAGFALKVASFGLLGVSVAYTLQLDADTHAIRITDSKVRAAEVLLGKDEYPKPGGSNPLRELYNRTYGFELFYFPTSSLKITKILSNEFEDQKWDPYNDICAIKAFQRTNNAVKKDNDSFFGADPKTSTRFDRNFSITEFLTINAGTEIALPLVAKVGGKPSLVSLYYKMAARAFEPFGKETGEVSYEASLAQALHWQRYITEGFPVSDTEVCIKCDPDFTSAYKAIHGAIGITKTFAENEDTLPLNVAMEFRFTKHSDSLLSPAYGQEGDVFCWIEVLSAVITPKLRAFTTRVADCWLAIKLKDGSQAARPHWAKWSEAYVSGADAKLKRSYADRLPHLQRVAKEYDPTGVFVNGFFARLFAP